MLNVIINIPKTLHKFLNKFKDYFSTIQFKYFAHYISGLFLSHKRVSIESIANLSPKINYNNLQYFISESKFDIEKVNQERINFLNHLRPTKSTKDGVLIIDDTASPKYGSHTEGAKKQYSSLEGKVINCHTVVVSSYADDKKCYPIELRAYKPLEEFENKNISQFKDKLQLGMELINNALANNKLQFSSVVFDSWYFSNDFVNELNEKSVSWISECQTNRIIFYQGKKMKAEELVKFLSPLKFRKPITFTNSKGEKRTLYLAECIIKIKGVNRKLKAVISRESWDEEDTKRSRILITNSLNLEAREIFKKYLLRWNIECIFRDLKDNIGFSQYQTRSLKAIIRHWYFVFFAYSFLLYGKLNAVFSKMVNISLNTIGDLISAFRRINTSCALSWINKHFNLFSLFLKLKAIKLT